MNYLEYIKLGFIRTDMNDLIEFNQTGYHGFTLEKPVNEKISIIVCSGNLDKPKLYIHKQDKTTNHIIPISTECVIDLLS